MYAIGNSHRILVCITSFRLTWSLIIHPHDVDLRALRTFVAVVENDGFVPAQATLDLALATISEQMKALETRLGVRLCERGRAGFRLSEPGREVYCEAQRLLAAVESFHEAVGGLHGRLEGELRIGLIDNTITDAVSPLPGGLRRFNQRNHNVRIRVRIGPPSELEPKLMDGRLHAVISPIQNRQPDLDFQPLYHELQLLYCGRDHPLFDAKPVTRDAIRRARVVARGYDSGAGLEKLEGCSTGAVVDNVEAQALLVLTGGYIGFLPRHYATHWETNGDLRALGMSYESAFGLITRRGGHPSEVLAAFRADLLAEIEAPQRPPQEPAGSGLNRFAPARHR